MVYWLFEEEKTRHIVSPDRYGLAAMPTYHLGSTYRNLGVAMLNLSTKLLRKDGNLRFQCICHDACYIVVFACLMSSYLLHICLPFWPISPTQIWFGSALDFRAHHSGCSWWQCGASLNGGLQECVQPLSLVCKRLQHCRISMQRFIVKDWDWTYL